MRFRIETEYDEDDKYNLKLYYMNNYLYDLHQKGFSAMRKTQALIKEQEGEYIEIC